MKFHKLTVSLLFKQADSAVDKAVGNTSPVCVCRRITFRVLAVLIRLLNCNAIKNAALVRTLAHTHYYHTHIQP